MPLESTSSRVVWAVADDRNTDPTELPPLEDFVDTEALDALVDGDADRGGTCTVRFSYAERTVHIRDGEITLEPLDRVPDS